MCISNLVIKMKPEEIPEFMRGKFFELHTNITHHVFAKDSTDGADFDYDSDEYVGWIHIREDGTIEFGEPGV